MKLNPALLFLFLIPMHLQAQEKLNSVSSPTSPASSILGLQPNSVLSPKSYQALEIGLYSNFSDQRGNSFLVNDFAFEFTPYWAKKRGLSLNDYLYPRNEIQQLIRNSSFSVASTPNFLLGDSTATNGIAFGYRTTFYFGNKSDREVLERYKAEIKASQSIQIRLIAVAERLIDEEEAISKNDFLAKIRTPVKLAMHNIGVYHDIKEVEDIVERIYQEAIFLPPLDLDNPEPFLDSFYELIDKHLNASILFSQFKSHIRNRPGLSLDVAYAGLLSFPTNNFNFSYLPRQSFWVTPTYRFKDFFDFLQVMGVIRFEWYQTEYYQRFFPENQTFEHNIDYGLGVSSELNKFSLKLEFVGRSSSSEILVGTDPDGNQLFRRDQGSDFQYIASFNYNLTDQIIISYSIGNRFEPIRNPSKTLVSLLTLNFGFGAPNKDDLLLGK